MMLNKNLLGGNPTIYLKFFKVVFNLVISFKRQWWKQNTNEKNGGLAKRKNSHATSLLPHPLVSPIDKTHDLY